MMTEQQYLSYQSEMDCFERPIGYKYAFVRRSSVPFVEFPDNAPKPYKAKPLNRTQSKKRAKAKAAKKARRNNR